MEKDELKSAQIPLEMYASLLLLLMMRMLLLLMMMRMLLLLSLLLLKNCSSQSLVVILVIVNHNSVCLVVRIFDLHSWSTTYYLPRPSSLHIHHTDIQTYTYTKTYACAYIYTRTRTRSYAKPTDFKRKKLALLTTKQDYMFVTVNIRRIWTWCLMSHVWHRMNTLTHILTHLIICNFLAFCFFLFPSRLVHSQCKTNFGVVFFSFRIHVSWVVDRNTQRKLERRNIKCVQSNDINEVG